MFGLGQQHTVFDAQEHSRIDGRSDFHVFWRHDGWLFPKFPIEPNARPMERVSM